MLSYYPHLFPLFSHVLSSFTLIRINNLLINIVEQLKTHSSRTLYLAASSSVSCDMLVLCFMFLFYVTITNTMAYWYDGAALAATRSPVNALFGA